MVSKVVLNKRYCPRCDTYLLPKYFYGSKTKGYQSYCKSCLNNYCKEHYKTNLKRYRKTRQDYKLNQRQRVLEYYGNKCGCCGEVTYEFLTVDHINNNGAKHRKELKGSSVYNWIIKNNFPDDFQILCYNCNCAKGFYGKCPHKA